MSNSFKTLLFLAFILILLTSTNGGGRSGRRGRGGHKGGDGSPSSSGVGYRADDLDSLSTSYSERRESQSSGGVGLSVNDITILLSNSRISSSFTTAEDLHRLYSGADTSSELNKSFVQLFEKYSTQTVANFNKYYNCYVYFHDRIDKKNINIKSKHIKVIEDKLQREDNNKSNGQIKKEIRQMNSDGTLAKTVSDYCFSIANAIMKNIESNAKKEMMEITMKAAVKSDQTHCPICKKDYDLEDMIKREDFIETSDCGKDQHLYHFFHRKCKLSRNDQSANDQNCPKCKGELNIVFHPEASKINETLRKIAWGTNLQALKDSYKN